MCVCVSACARARACVCVYPTTKKNNATVCVYTGMCNCVRACIWHMCGACVCIRVSARVRARACTCAYALCASVVFVHVLARFHTHARTRACARRTGPVAYASQCWRRYKSGMAIFLVDPHRPHHGGWVCVHLCACMCGRRDQWYA